MMAPELPAPEPPPKAARSVIDGSQRGGMLEAIGSGYKKTVAPLTPPPPRAEGEEVAWFNLKASCLVRGRPFAPVQLYRRFGKARGA